MAAIMVSDSQEVRTGNPGACSSVLPDSDWTWRRKNWSGFKDDRIPKKEKASQDSCDMFFPLENTWKLYLRDIIAATVE